MEKVYVLIHKDRILCGREEEMSEIYKIFSTEDKAKEYMEEAKAEEPRKHFIIEEWEVQ